MVPHRREVVIQTIGPIQTTPNGNRYLECQADCGQLCLWLAPQRAALLDELRTRPLPLRLTLECLKDRQTAGLYWVPETVHIVLPAPSPAQPSSAQPSSAQPSSVQPSPALLGAATPG